MKNLTASLILVASGTAVLVTIGVLSRPHRRTPAPKPVFGPSPSPEARRKTNEEIVRKYEHDPAPQSQDKVGEAKMHLAYLSAQKNDFASSRKLFLQAEKIKGTGAMGADFGGINDQAAYQAAVCLVAEHKESEAKAAFRMFLVDYKLSPLAAAAEKRLVRLGHGKADPNDEGLLQTAIRAQEEKGRFETTVCGPKTMAYLMKEFPKCFGGRQAKDYKELAKLFGTGPSGTSLEELHDGLKKLGIESFAVDLNRQDFEHLKLPAILLDGDHYFAILERRGRQVTVYDTLLSAKREIKMPELTDADFRATVLAFSMDGLDEDNLAAGAPPKNPGEPQAVTGGLTSVTHPTKNTSHRF